MIALEKRCGQKMDNLVPDDYSRHSNRRRLRSPHGTGFDIYDQVVKSYRSFGSYSFYIPYIDTFGLHKQKGGNAHERYKETENKKKGN